MSWWAGEMTLKQKWGLSWGEAIVTILIAGGGLYAMADGYRLLTRGTPAASWTATYIASAGVILVLLAVASLLPFSRRAASTSITSKVADDVLDDAGPSSEEPVLDEEVPPRVARSLLVRTTALLTGWVLVLPLIGYIAATALFLIAYGILVSRRRVVTTLVFAAIATAASTGIFLAVGIRLPMGSIF